MSHQHEWSIWHTEDLTHVPQLREGMQHRNCLACRAVQDRRPVRVTRDGIEWEEAGFTWWAEDS